MKVSDCTNIATHYTPSIEDIFIGYEAEFNWCTSGGFVTFNDDNTPDIMIEPTTKQWETIKCGYPQTIMDSSRTPADFYSILKNGCLRTPYLTTEQIEKERWDTWKGEGDTTPYHLLMFWGAYRFEKPNYILIFNFRKHEISIASKFDGLFKGQQIFKGICPSINEFRTIMKFLNIK